MVRYTSHMERNGNTESVLFASAEEEQLGSAISQRRRTARVRTLMVSSALLVLLIALIIVDVLFGHEIYSFTDALTTIFGGNVPGVSFAIGELRLPRVIIAGLSGCAFAMAGASFQYLFRNLMASPDIIGITAGANTAAVSGIVLLGLSGMPLALLAVAGGMLTALLVLWLAWNGTFSYQRLILMGIGVATALQALTSWILIRANQWDIQTASRWLTGSVASARWQSVPPMLFTLLAAGSLLLVLSNQADVLRFGNEIAAGLGIRVRLMQIVIITVSVLLLSVATATSGPISFVSFLAGPIAMRLTHSHKPAIMQSGLIGASLVLAADIVAQHIPPAQLPVGVVTSIVGGPILVTLMIRMTRRQEL